MTSFQHTQTFDFLQFQIQIQTRIPRAGPFSSSIAQTLCSHDESLYRIEYVPGWVGSKRANVLENS
jgi:hypothetical protein